VSIGPKAKPTINNGLSGAAAPCCRAARCDRSRAGAIGPSPNPEVHLHRLLAAFSYFRRQQHHCADNSKDRSLALGQERQSGRPFERPFFSFATSFAHPRLVCGACIGLERLDFNAVICIHSVRTGFPRSPMLNDIIRLRLGLGLVSKQSEREFGRPTIVANRCCSSCSSRKMDIDRHGFRRF
jgi:hypothetical protein